MEEDERFWMDTTDDRVDAERRSVEHREVLRERNSRNGAVVLMVLMGSGIT